MRVECSLLVQTTKTSNNRNMRAVKGFVSLGKSKMKGRKGVDLQYFTNQNRKEPPIEIEPSNVSSFLTNFVSAGRMTIGFRKPAVTLFVSNCDSARLGRFCSLLKRALNGEQLELSTIDKVTTTDFNQVKSVEVRSSIDFTARKKAGYPSSIEQLTVVNCGLKQIDCRWFACTRLVNLDLSQNTFGTSDEVQFGKFRLLARLKMLRQLNLSRNEITRFPPDLCFPASLLSVDLSHNKLTAVPKILFRSGLKSLQSLNLSHNLIKVLPVELSFLPLKILNVSSNRLTNLPFSLTRMRIDSLSIDGNNLSDDYLNLLGFENLPSVSTLASLTSAIVRRLHVPDVFIPWTAAVMMDYETKRCTVCYKWTPTNELWSKGIQMRPLDFCTQVDVNQEVSVLLAVCRKCVPIVRNYYLNRRR